MVLLKHSGLVDLKLILLQIVCRLKFDILTAMRSVPMSSVLHILQVEVNT